MAENPTYEELKQRVSELERQNELLQFEAAKYRTLFDSFPHGITVSDFQGNIVEANSISEQLLGISKEEHQKRDIAGQEWRIIRRDGTDMPPDEWASVIALKEKRIVTDCEMGIVKPDGQTTWINVTAAPLPIEGYGVVIIYNDITKKKEAEAALRQSEEKYRKLYEDAAIGIFHSTFEGRFLDVNPALARMLGYETPEDVVNSIYSIAEQVYVEPQARDEIIAQALTKGETVKAENRFRRKDGSEWYANIHLRHVCDSNGQPVCLEGFLEDITERKRGKTYREMGMEILQILNEPGNLHESIQRVLAVLKTRTGVDAVGMRLQDGEDFPYFFQDGFSDDFLLTENTLIERDKDGGICRDKNGNVRLECTCGLVISGKTDPSIPFFTRGGSSWTNNSFPLLDVPSDQDPRLHARNNCIHQGYASVALIPVRTSDRIVGLIQLNDRRKGRFTLETIEILEGIAAHVGSALMRKQAEENLEKSLQKITASRNELEHEVAERFKVEGRLKEAIEAAEAANKTKSEFLANMSHEIRTPLNAVIGFSQMLYSQDFGPLNPKQAQYVNHVMEGGNRLLVLINDILDLSRVESGKIRSHSESFNFKRFMEQIESTLSVFAEKRGLAFEVEVDSGIPEYLTGDEKHIGQVLRNLVSNAVKFTEQGTVHVWVENHSGDLRVFKVSDTGTGIPEEKQHRLFDEFFQADSSYTKQYEGTGLGLAISKNLVELMGGEIGFESEQGKGSTFYFTLELPAGDTKAAAPVEKASSFEPEPSEQPGLNILLAEDDRLTRKAMTHFLEKAGHTLTGAETGKEVLSILESDRFDIILMDVQMPEMDGVEATKTIRNSTSGRWNPKIPIIALTAYAMAGDREQFIDSGMTDYISKPVNFAELKQKINRLNRDGFSEKDLPQPEEEDHDHLSMEEDIADIRTFLESNKEDPEFVGKILKSFPGHVSKRIARLEAAVENRDAEETAAAAHKFIALFSAVYIRSACKTGRDLQNAARSDDLAACEQLFPRLKVKMQQIIHYIQLIKEE